MKNVTFKIDLEINAQRIIQQVKLHNQSIEEQIEKGVLAAVKELSDNDGIANHVKELTIDGIKENVSWLLNGYVMQNKIQSIIEDKVKEKIGLYANNVAENILKELSKLNQTK